MILFNKMESKEQTRDVERIDPEDLEFIISFQAQHKALYSRIAERKGIRVYRKIWREKSETC